MLRYREALGLLPPARDPHGKARHRQYAEEDLEAVRLALELETRYDVTPAALAFGLRVLTEPEVATRLRELGRRIGRLPGPSRSDRATDPIGDGRTPDGQPVNGVRSTVPASRAQDFEKARALRWLQSTRRDL